MVQISISISRRHLVFLLLAVVVLVVAIPLAVSATTSMFADVPDNHIFVEDINWMKTAGVTQGCGDGTNYCPNDNVTRGQMAAFMHRLSGDDATTITGRLDALEALLAGVTRNGDTLLFTGMNLQVVNGEGETDTHNSVGNVIIGYNELRPLAPRGSRVGSHYLIIGPHHSYTSYGGIVAGDWNTASGGYASVTGGSNNHAAGHISSVTGGAYNSATVSAASVSGGEGNIASNYNASVSGGRDNIADGQMSSILGGLAITVTEPGGHYPG